MYVCICMNTYIYIYMYKIFFFFCCWSKERKIENILK